MKRYKGLGRVFSFTLTQQLRQRGWRTATIAMYNCYSCIGQTDCRISNRKSC